MFAVEWTDVERLSGAISAAFAGCALMISVISLYFSLCSGPVRLIVVGGKTLSHLCNSKFNIPIVFYNGKNTAVVICYSILLATKARELQISGLGHEVTVLVAPRSYEVTELECSADVVSSPSTHSMRVKWSYLKKGREKGPYVRKWDVQILPHKKKEVFGNEGNR